MTCKKELKKLALEDLKRSGLNAKDFNKMKLQVLTSEQSGSILNHGGDGVGYVMPYFDLKNKPLDFIRYRYLEDVTDKKGKLIRYSQPKGTGTKLYFPPCINWLKISKDASITIYITEGEKKAYAACKAGIPTIGLGGVNSFICKHSKELHEDFNEIALHGRKVLICYDNDLHSNEDVNKAADKLAIMLFNKGANVFNKVIPFNPYEKVGLDDFLLVNTVEDFNNLEEVEFIKNAAVSALNTEVAYIREAGKYYIFKDKLFVNEKHLSNVKYSNSLVEGTSGNPVSVASIWNASKQRREHNRLTYKPAQPEVTDEDEFNLWEGMGCTPLKGCIKPFTTVLNKIFDNDERVIKWFMDWVAYPIQHPATKMLQGVLILSVQQGTGKSSLGLAIGAMYGKNYGLVDDAQLHGDFNEWAVNKQFILGDEVSGKDKRSESDKIKNLITRPTITINRKYMPSYVVPDCINYFFTSNHTDALSLEPDDRRIFVHEIEHGKGITPKQGKALEDFRLGKGKGYLLNYFLNEHVISEDFSPITRPPMTKAKLSLIDASRSQVERFLNDVIENPDHTLVTASGVPLKGDLYTTTDIIKVHDSTYPDRKTNPTAMGKALNKEFNHSPSKMTGTLKGMQNLRPLRNIEKWRTASHQERQEHYDKHNNRKAKQTKHKVME